ncbi:cysteine peptidase family C39 domain-containing protein, partial [Rhizobium ruizarguesonis]
SAEQLAHEFSATGQGLSLQELLLAALKSGLKVRAVQTRLARLQYSPLPAIAMDNDGSFFIPARVDKEQALIQDPGPPLLERLKCEDFRTR